MARAINEFLVDHKAPSKESDCAIDMEQRITTHENTVEALWLSNGLFQIMSIKKNQSAIFVEKHWN